MNTLQKREKAIRKYFSVRQGVFKYRLEIKEAKRIWVNDYKVGEILNTCWGYDQTNREFYEIIAVKGKKVTLRQIAVTSYAT